MKPCISRLASTLLIYAPIAAAGQCEDPATPQEFNGESAMKAVFCAYNGEHGGTLLPLKYTESWNNQQAESLATPILAEKYQENGKNKAVLAVQRQSLVDGEPSDSHAQSVIISVYVFRHDGTKWVFEKGKKEAADAGSYGAAPDAKLARLGAEKYGLWFESSYTGQGYVENRFFVLALSEPTILEIGQFDAGRDNGGICTDDAAESDVPAHACWSYEGSPDFMPAEGAEYYTLRIRYRGTEAQDGRDGNRIVARDTPECYVKSDQGYRGTDDPKCGAYPALAPGEIFVKGKSSAQ